MINSKTTVKDFKTKDCKEVMVMLTMTCAAKKDEVFVQRR